MDSINEIIAGTVENITYRNNENGYSVIELNTSSEQITVVGILPLINVGEFLKVKGCFTIHPSYGSQFKAESCESSMPATSAAILRYLSSGAIKGIGPVTAQSIVSKFGEQSLEIIEKSPERLSEIKGISRAKAEKIAEEYQRQFGVREVMLKLAELKITASEAIRIYKKLGNTSIELIKENPFLLCSEGIGIGFDRADEVSSNLDSNIPYEYRTIAGIDYILKHNIHNGHTCLPKDKLVDTAASMLGYNAETVESVLYDMIKNDKLASFEINETQFIFLPFMYKAESYCANRIALMLKVPPQEIAIHKSRLEQIEENNELIYDSKQREAIASALSKGLLVLTGGPGTGKTTTLNAIITLLEEAGSKIALAAPTGRAAKRMGELTGREAKTIHRLLEVEWGDDERQFFKRNESNPLEHNVLIVDELSMLDVQLFDALLKAMTIDCRLIMVGDVDQLPPVGAGNVLHDLIDSGCVPVVRLTRIFRQAAQSSIINNAHKIISGKMPTIQNNDTDFYVVNSRAQIAIDLISDLYSERLTNAFDFLPLSDIQILCPSRKRVTGVININNVIQSKINPPSRKKKEITQKGFTLREGDKVMQIKNNYDVCWTKQDGSDGSGVFNGDIGILKSIDVINSSFTIQFDDRTALYSGEEIEDVELAYAVTVHKSQGNEFDCVILPVEDIPFQLCYRNLLYTAVTRAKRMLVIIGSVSDLKRMIDNNKKTKRYTAFSYLLYGAVENN